MAATGFGIISHRCLSRAGAVSSIPQLTADDTTAKWLTMLAMLALLPCTAPLHTQLRELGRARVLKPSIEVRKEAMKAELFVASWLAPLRPRLFNAVVLRLFRCSSEVVVRRDPTQ
eukprot:Polyplicarium_translucidae@DN1074_c0_g1_i1.p2